MRDTVWGVIHEVWCQCMLVLLVNAPDVTIEIYEDCMGLSQWRISHESSYQSDLEQFCLRGEYFFEGSVLKNCSTVFYQDLVRLQFLDERGEVAKVFVRSKLDSFCVFKGFSFGDFLKSRYNSKHIANMHQHEICTFASFPKHSNMQAPPGTFVLARGPKYTQSPRVCGAFYPFMEKGTVDAQILNANNTGVRIPLSLKLKWCFQLCSSLHYVHFEVHIYHMDIKPPNLLLDTNKDFILIDFEQCDASRHILAP